MSDDIPDNFAPGFQLDPLFGYEGLAEILDPLTGRLYGRFGEKGLTIEEATKRAAFWWDSKGRINMPDYGKPDDYIAQVGFNSGIYLGLPWSKLNRDERVRVITVWHNEIGILNGIGITTEKELNNVLEQERTRAFDLTRIVGGDPSQRPAGGKPSGIIH